MPEASPRDGLPIVSFLSPDEWEEWLDDEYATSRGVWLKIARKGTGRLSVSYDEALDVALAYGWIDGQKGRYDDEHWVQRFTPRTPRSRWSKINCARAGALIAAGRMRPAGLAEVERAKADGRWEAAYDGQSTATVPEDLQRALDASPAARDFFATLSGANRYAILYRVQDAKRPDTRARRIAQLVEMLAERRTLHP
ncbi:MAG: hypothetical protein QOJ21_2294 [Solirubrobacteraceae bacterium]|nr:hypothetical protein [Solirubrobacteraceae bacterium]